MIGQLVGPYKVLSKLGEGGMGVVYRAEDTRLHRPVAVKFLPGDVAPNPDSLARFEREARAASALDHPNICTIYDVGEHEGRPFIVMALLEGQTLSKIIGRGHSAPAARPGIDEALGLALQIVDGLDAAHAKGIIHRDIKPANLFLTSRGEVKILDFGLAKAIEANDQTTVLRPPELTTPGQALGTAAYMSPEQARGEPLDARTDLFSTGAVLYELFTGRPAFDGETMAVVFASLLGREPAPARQINPDVPPEIEAILAKALEKDRGLRYQSVADLRADLWRVKRNRTNPTASAPAIAPPQRRSTRSMAAALAVVAVMVAAGAFWWANRPGGGAPIESIAVLPFENVGGDPNTEYLSDGLTDSLINALSQVQGLRVVPRSTMFTYKNRASDQQQVGRDLGVHAVLSGQVTQRGDTLVVRASLMDVSKVSNLWGDTFDRKMADLLTIEKDLAREIFGGLRVRLSGDEAKRLSARSTTNTEALNLYYRGLHHRQKTTEEGFRASIRYFQEAVDLDPRFALAYAGLSDAYGSLGYLQVGAPAEIWPRAKAAADAALAIDPDLAEAHAARGHAILRYDWNPEEAKAAIERAIELNPRHAVAHHWYAHYKMAYDPGPGILAESRKAVELEPGDLNLNVHLFYMERGAAQADQLALDVANVQKIDPDFWGVHMAMATLHGHKKDLDGAQREYERAVKSSGELPLPLQTLGFFYAGRGNRRGVEDVIARLKQRSYPPPMYIAGLYNRLGEDDKAVEWLERAFKERDGAMIDLLSRGWAEARKKDPRIENLAKRVRDAKR